MKNKGKFEAKKIKKVKDVVVITMSVALFENMISQLSDLVNDGVFPNDTIHMHDPEGKIMILKLRGKK